MKSRISEELLRLTAELKQSRERKEQLRIADELHSAIERLLQASGNERLCQAPQSVTASLCFQEEELMQMDARFRQEFLENGGVARITKRAGEKSYCYEIRYRSNVYHVFASANSLKQAKRCFLRKTATKEIGHYQTDL